MTTTDQTFGVTDLLALSSSSGAAACGSGGAPGTFRGTLSFRPSVGELEERFSLGGIAGDIH